MSKLKIIDMNRQLMDKSKQTVARMESLQVSVQAHLATLKRIEAELIKVARAEAEEKRNRQQQEEMEQARAEAEAKAASEVRAAEETTVKPEEAQAVSAEQRPPSQAEAVREAPVKAEPVSEKTPETPAAQAVNTMQAKEAEATDAIKQADNNEVVIKEAAPTEQRPRQEKMMSEATAEKKVFTDRRPPRTQQGMPYSQDGRPPRTQDGRPPRTQDGRPPRTQDGRPPRAQDGRPPRAQDGRPPRAQDGRPPRTQDGRPPRAQDGRPPRAQDGRPPRAQDGRPPRAQESRPPQGKRTPSAKSSDSDMPGFVQVEKRSGTGKKNQHGSAFVREDRGHKSKKALMRERVGIDEDERYRGKRRTKIRPAIQPMPVVIDKAVMNTEMISIKSLAEKTGKPVADILKKLLLLGMMCTINSEIDYDTAQLICNEFKIDLEYKPEKTAEDVLDEGDQKDAEEDLIPRPPIVTVMGHVDHGKTSLLDAIRKTRVTEHEAGGITQHIGAYTIKHNDRIITFLDTPGHEAFTAMRARGAQVTDIAILVVAADDGVMPQTVEAINHAKAADVPIIVAINKIDKPNANPERVKQDLTEYGLLTEEWGGDTIMVPVSAVTKEGIEQLLEMILLVAEVQELKANPNRLAKGTIIEAKLDKGRGPVATVLVQNGTLHISDMIVAGVSYGRVRAMTDDMGNRVEEALPSQPVEVIGFSEVPVAGDVLHAVEQDKLTRQVAEERKDKQKADILKNLSKVSLEDLFNQVEEGKVKDLNIVIKADVQGSVEAVKQALEKLSNSEVHVKVIHAGVGAIKAMDVMLASASNAIIIGFNVRPDTMARAEAEKEKVEVRLYRIIYKAIEDIELAIKGMLAPEFKEVTLGHAEIRTIFNVSNIGTIAGSYVTDGKITKNASVRLLRDNIVVHEGELASLKRFKDDVKEVSQGYECGFTIKNYNDIKEGDVIEAFEMQEIKR